MLKASSLVFGEWSHWINGSFDEERGSWSSATDNETYGYWNYLGDDVADVYLDSNKNNQFDSGDQLIGRADVLYTDDSYTGGSWHRFRGLREGYFGGSAWGLFEVTSPLEFDTSEQEDRIAGSIIRDIINGLGGNDEIYSSDGNDEVTGGNNQDKLFLGSGDDFGHGNHGKDYLDGDSGNDVLRGGHGHDEIYGGSGSDWIWGGVGRNTIDAGLNDGNEDKIFVPDDQVQNTQFGNPGGANADILNNIGSEDRIFIHGSGISDSSLTYEATSHNGMNGIGIYANGTLEALVTGSFNISQISTITSAGFFA